ncbi:MAG: hypothetical protein GVY16_05520 [Planctomycetes bacterium]|jgi:hypothetical protein|nr:hypothetical protein [Planctomycetota bacterium]
MKRTRWTTVVAIILTMTLAICSLAQGQSRKRRTISGPSGVGRGVAANSLYDFRRFSAGVGSLQKSRPLERSALQSSMYNPRSYRGGLSVGMQQQRYNPTTAPIGAASSSTRSIRRGPARPQGTGITNVPAPSTGPARTSRSTRTYDSAVTPPAYLTDTTGAPYPAPREAGDAASTYMLEDPQTILMRQLSATRSSMSYAAALAPQPADQRELPVQSDETITSLAPDKPGLPRRFMRSGEEAFRNGRYGEAASAFTGAADVTSRSPEALLSLTRARFAQKNYGRAGLNLIEALQQMPELSLIPIDPRNFYDDPATFTEHLAALQTQVDQTPWGPRLNLLLAYYRFRTGDMRKVREPLSKALAVARRDENEDMEDAALILWDGLLARSLVDGELQPAELPQTEPILPDERDDAENVGTGATPDDTP